MGSRLPFKFFSTLPVRKWVEEEKFDLNYAHSTSMEKATKSQKVFVNAKLSMKFSKSKSCKCQT